MTATTLTALKAAQRALLLKPLDAAVFLAPWYTAAPTAFTDTSSLLQALPAAYQSVGLIEKKAGIAFSRATTDAPIESYGELQATRDDITSDMTTIEFEPQQTTALTLSLATRANLASITANGGNGEVLIAQPTDEQITYYSAIVIGRDGSSAAPIYVFKVMPKVAVTKWAGEQWTPTNTLSQKMTLTAFKDDTAGYAVAHGFGGLGWKNLLLASGISYSITAITIVPATISASHTASVAALTVTDQLGGVVPNSSVGWVSGTPATATIGASTGVLTYVAAGTTVITATYTPSVGSPVTSTCTITLS